jgi:hypothetical protein
MRAADRDGGEGKLFIVGATHSLHAPEPRDSRASGIGAWFSRIALAVASLALPRYSDGVLCHVPSPAEREGLVRSKPGHDQTPSKEGAVTGE